MSSKVPGVPRPSWTASWRGFVPKPGRVTLTPMLTPKGQALRRSDRGLLWRRTTFMLFGSGTMQEAHRRWFERDLPADVALSQRQ